MSIYSSPRRGLGIGSTVALSIACLGLLAGCGSSGKSTASNNAAAGGSTGAAGAATSAATTAAAAAGGAVPGCPTAAQVSAIMGQTFPAPKSQSTSGGVYCNFTNASGGNVVVGVVPFPGGTSSALGTAIASQAQAEGVKAVAVPGLGSAAYLFTLNDASTNSSGVATTTLAILTGTNDVDITAQATTAQVEAIARDMLAG
jgi:hypothetical protein